MNKIFPLLIAFATLPVLRAAEPKSDANWKKLADLYAKMEDVKVISGNELEIAGIRCRLFGIQIPEDERKVAAAKRFLEHYVDNYRPYLTIYNAEWPINAKDDVPLIWLKGSGRGGWAQETLVQAGLATVNYEGFETYTFNTPTKQSGEFNYPWMKCLKDAEASFKRGAEPNVNFRWPESK